MGQSFPLSVLEAYLDEELAPDESAVVEKSLRADPALRKQLAAINIRRDAGLHSLGSIWRRHRVTCPSRERLGSYLMRILPNEEAEFIRFHLETIKCRVCQANVQDLKADQAESADTVAKRRKRYFQSSAGYLRGKKDSS